jgi:hypothetical protein
MSSPYGPQRLLGDLQALGYPAELVNAGGHQFAVVCGYEVVLGRFLGRRIDLGLQATADFPMTVATAIHVRSSPHLYDLGDTLPNVRNIQPSALGGDWRYWSHNFGWGSDKTARRLMSQVNKVFQDAK